MKYSQQEIIQYVQEEDVKFIRLAFCDVSETEKHNPSCLMSFKEPFLTVSPLTRPPSMDLVMRLIQIYFFIQNRIL